MTMQLLAQQALDVQDACNLSGVVHAWSRAVTRLRELRPDLGTDGINTHPVCVLFADKCAQLAGATDHRRCCDAFDQCVILTQPDATEEE